MKTQNKFLNSVVSSWTVTSLFFHKLLNIVLILVFYCIVLCLVFVPGFDCLVFYYFRVSLWYVLKYYKFLSLVLITSFYTSPHSMYLTFLGRHKLRRKYFKFPFNDFLTMFVDKLKTTIIILISNAETMYIKIFFRCSPVYLCALGLTSGTAVSLMNRLYTYNDNFYCTFIFINVFK